MADDIGYADFSCYGAKTIATPHIDELAANGIRFTNAYAPASTSSPSRYALLTGEYAFRKRVGILPADAPLTIDPQSNNLPLQLKSSGYTTGIVGKWHLGLGNRNETVDFNKKITAGMRSVGFDYSYIFPATNDRVPTIFLENDQVVNGDPNDPIKVSYRKKIGNEPTGKENPDLLTLKYYQGHDGTIINGISRIGWMSGGHKARWNDQEMGEVLSNQAVSFIRENKQKPFFLYYATHNAHEPRVPNPKFAGQSKAGIYGDMIEEFDEYVGRIIETLKKEGIFENTLLIISSDNAPMIKEGYHDGAEENIGSHRPCADLRGAKYSLYEGGTKVPFIVSYPSLVKKPFVQTQRFSYIDMLATVASITQAKPYRNSLNDSKDASELFRSPSAPVYRDYIITQNNGGDIAIRKNDWKYIPSKNELFHLKKDPNEKINLSQTEKGKSIINDLSSLIKNIANKDIQDDILSLTGQWGVKLDPDSIGEKHNYFNSGHTTMPIQLPGTLDEAGYGTRTVGSDYGILTRRHKYIGPAWYTREFVIPHNWQGKEITLYLERVLWESKVWIDGRFIDTQEGLGTPHYHRLGTLNPGKHRIAIRINNDMIYNIGDKGHSYGEYTQIIWNGILGKIELQSSPTLSIDRIKVYPHTSDNRLDISFDIQNHSNKTLKGEVSYTLKEIGSKKKIYAYKKEIKGEKGIQHHRETLNIRQAVKHWDDLHPNLYRLEICITQKGQSQLKTVDFGFRNVTASRSKILINNRPVFMRGNLDCLHFPLTGYPSCDIQEWERIFRIYKSYGLNHVRFHSWCPPEAAFTAADRIGIYIQAEVLWIDWWMSVVRKERPEMTTRGLPKGLGHNPSADKFVPEELQRMIEAYGNHPSFTMLCIGNELGNSNFDIMQQWIKSLQEKDPRRLYAISTARKIMPADQYMVTHNIPQTGGTYGINGSGTDNDRESIYSKATIPVIAHEVGQYPVYPLWNEIDKYTGVLEARNLESLRQQAVKNHIEHQDRKFHEASGALQTILYKGLIENLLRTPSCAGFQMLSMTDYSGQGEALVGWLDSFWDSKGIITPEQFRCYSNDIVPLARFHKYTWQTDETFKAQIQVANYSDTTLITPTIWTLTDETGKLQQQGSREVPLSSGKVNQVDSLSIDLSEITSPGKYYLDVTISGTPYHNRWSIWVYPPYNMPQTNIIIHDKFDSTVISALEQGKKVLLVADQLGKKDNSTPLYFTPLFWSTSFFPGQSNTTLGAWIDKAHPAFSQFPTDNYTDWQWKEITQGRSFIINEHPQLHPIVQPVSDFHINDKLASIFECKVSKGKLLVCGYNLNLDSPVARQLKYSLLHYMTQSNFNPSYSIEIDTLKKMFAYTPKAMVSVPKGFENSILYISCGKQMRNSGSAPWTATLDHTEIQDERCKYKVTCDNIWKDEKGTAWTGKNMTIEIQTPEGIIGDLYVKFEDWNHQNRAGLLSIEGRESILENQKGKERWVKLFIMREDTNDGKIVLKTHTKQGGNLMISQIAFIKQ